MFLAFLHAFSNVIQSCPVFQVTEQRSFEFHLGQKKPQACPNHQTQMHLHLQKESKKGWKCIQIIKIPNKLSEK